MDVGAPLVADGQAVEATQPGERPFNVASPEMRCGLLTVDACVLSAAAI